MHAALRPRGQHDCATAAVDSPTDLAVRHRVMGSALSQQRNGGCCALNGRLCRPTSRGSAARAAPVAVGACRAYPGRGRVVGRLRARQKGFASRSKVPNDAGRQQSDSMRRSPSLGLHDNPRDASHRLPRLPLERNALRRQFDDVRRMDPGGLSRLEFDQDDQPAPRTVSAIDAGDHRPGVTRPERPL